MPSGDSPKKSSSRNRPNYNPSSSYYKHYQPPLQSYPSGPSNATYYSAQSHEHYGNYNRNSDYEMNMDEERYKQDLRNRLNQIKETRERRSSSDRNRSSQYDSDRPSVSSQVQSSYHQSSHHHSQNLHPRSSSSSSSSSSSKHQSRSEPSSSKYSSSSKHVSKSSFSSKYKEESNKKSSRSPEENDSRSPKDEEKLSSKEKPKLSKILTDAEVTEIFSEEEHSDEELKEENSKEANKDKGEQLSNEPIEDETEEKSEKSVKQTNEDSGASKSRDTSRSRSVSPDNNEPKSVGSSPRSNRSQSTQSTDRIDQNSDVETTKTESVHEGSTPSHSDNEDNDSNRRVKKRSKSNSRSVSSGQSSSEDDDEGSQHKHKKKKSSERTKNRSDSQTSSRKSPEPAPAREPSQEPKSEPKAAPVPEIVYYCAIQGCRSVEEFECLNKIEEGAYGVVYRAKDKKSNHVVALKRLKMEKEREGFPITSLREVDTLLKCQHPNVVTVREIVVGSNMDKIYMVMDYVEHDLKSLMQYSMKKPFLMSEVKTLMLQLLSGIAHLHDNWIIHRDLKTSNLLLSHKGVLKIADFGLAREYGSPLKEYTPVVVTLWYRCPELLLATKKYSTAIDMWSVGCIFGELMLMKALFPGKNEKDQLDKIFKVLGTPTEKIWPGFKELPLATQLKFPDFPYNSLRSSFGQYLSDKGFELINRLLTYDPIRRISAEEALNHDFFRETPLPIDPSIFPTWPAKSEGLNKNKIPQDSEPRAPSAGKMYEKMIADDDGFVLQKPISTGFTLR